MDRGEIDETAGLAEAELDELARPLEEGTWDASAYSGRRRAGAAAAAVGVVSANGAVRPEHDARSLLSIARRAGGKSAPAEEGAPHGGTRAWRPVTFRPALLSGW